MRGKHRFWEILALGAAIGVSFNAFALTIETPLNSEVTTAGLGSGKVVVGLDYSKILDRQLDGSGSASGQAKSGRITSSNQVHVKAVYSVNQYLNLYGKLGGSDWSDKLVLNNGSQIETDYEMALSWAVGANGGRQFSKNWQLFYDIQFLMARHADVSAVTDGGRNTGSTGGSVDVDEFQVALGIGKEIHTYYEWASVIFPYVGVTYSTFNIDHRGLAWQRTGFTGSFEGELDADYNFGVFTGIRIANQSNWLLRFEARFLNETAFTAGLDYRY